MKVCLDSAILITAFRARRVPELLDWLSEHDVMTCDLVRAEIRSGILGTANARTREAQEAWYADTLARVPSRQLDRALCEQAAILCGSARRRGYQARIDDALVAAAAQDAEATVVSSNVSHFEQLGVPVVNPFAPS
ncbi:MAG: type II toxin-antitoxin system VapC family toxin [Chloroflexaceae bacterium]|nr:type II toxin-antitoxin system VapC family toxin [Chloroflexaceae bacterium]